MSTPGSADGWVRACRLADLGEGKPVHADIGQCPVCLVRAGGAAYALPDECTHQAVPLSDGEVTGGAIECWLHGSASTWRPAGARPGGRGGRLACQAGPGDRRRPARSAAGRAAGPRR